MPELGPNKSGYVTFGDSVKATNMQKNQRNPMIDLIPDGQTDRRTNMGKSIIGSTLRSSHLTKLPIKIDGQHFYLDSHRVFLFTVRRFVQLQI